MRIYISIIHERMNINIRGERSNAITLIPLHSHGLRGVGGGGVEEHKIFHLLPSPLVGLVNGYGSA